MYEQNIIESARSLRVKSGLPKDFWAEVVNTSAYLIKRGPSMSLEHKMPEEAWYEKVVKLSHIRVFGCVIYVHISDQGMNNLILSLRSELSSVMARMSLAIASEMMKSKGRSLVE